MKAKKIVRYRLPVSVKFPATHKRAGEPTYFIEKIELALGHVNTYCSECFFGGGNCKQCFVTNGEVWPKLHTIRGNYDLWAKRFEKIQRGEAVLELYYWSGKPYNSKCVTICQLGKEDGVGVEKLTFIANDINFPHVAESLNSWLSIGIVAKNDGLSLEDFKEWFRGYDLSKTMAIIHFTSFRY